jgi:oligopeptide/dipeptide ABC transporter ATP-binding protein
MEILRVENLEISLIKKKDSIKIVNGVSLKIHIGETVGLIGPTGTGKTITAKAIIRLLQPLGKLEWRIEGEVYYNNKDLMKLPEKEFRTLMGNELSIIFQNPTSSLNPILMIGQQTGEPVEAHKDVESRRLKKMVIDHLGKVELKDAKKRYRFFRHQFSGGEAQRIMIAMALINGPSILIADEPTSNLDVTIQGQVLELLKKMKKDFDLSTLLITHDLGVIAEMSDYVYVMYAGKIIEHSDVITIFKEPKHPYTKALLRSIPRIDRNNQLLEVIQGDPPQPPYEISGCVFNPRCKYFIERCKEEIPVLKTIRSNHYVACLRINEIKDFY